MLIFLQSESRYAYKRYTNKKNIYACELCFIRRNIQTFLSKLTRIFQNI